MEFIFNKDLISYEENNEIMLINMSNNNFYTLDQTGTIIWKEIIKYNDLKIVINNVSILFNEEMDTIQKDIKCLVDQLIKAGVMKKNV